MVGRCSTLTPVCRRDREGLSARAHTARPPRHRRMVLHRRLSAAQQGHAAPAARLCVRTAFFQLPSAIAFSTMSLAHYATLHGTVFQQSAILSSLPSWSDGHAGDQPRLLLGRAALSHTGPCGIRFHRLPPARRAQHHLRCRCAAIDPVRVQRALPSTAPSGSC